MGKSVIETRATVALNILALAQGLFYAFLVWQILGKGWMV